MFEFLVLPREIRNKIYFYALVRPYDLIPFPTEWQHEDHIVQDDQIERDAPTVGLLATCKLIHAEGHLAFYNRNRFRLPIAHFNVAMDDPLSIFVHHKADIRHISVSFDSRDRFLPMGKYIFVAPRESMHRRAYQRERMRSRETMEKKQNLMHVAARSLQDGTALPALRTIVLGKFRRCICEVERNGANYKCR